MSVNWHLLTKEEQSLLDEAALIAFSYPLSKNIVVYYGEESIDENRLWFLLQKVEERPWYWVHNRGECTDIFERGGKLIATIPRPEVENTADILSSVGLTNVSYLEQSDITKLMVIAYYVRGLDIMSPACNDFIRSISSTVCDSLFIGREKLNQREEVLVYGDSEEETQKMIRVKAINGNNVLLPVSKKKGVFEERLLVNPPLHKIFALLIAKARTGDQASFSIDEYMELCGLKNKHDARMRVKELLDVIFKMEIYVNGYTEKTEYRIIYKKVMQTRKGSYTVVFSPDFLEHIRNHKDAHIFDIPKEFFKIDNPTAYCVAVYANLHRRRNINKPNQDIINIGTLLRGTYLPTNTMGRSAKQLIIDPLRKSLAGLFDQRVMYAQLVRPGSGEPVLETSDDFLRAWEDLSYLKTLNLKISWLCSIPDYEVKT